MNNYPCNVIIDLLPSYIDGVCSEKTNADIKNHLDECPKCRKAYESMKEDLITVSKPDSSASEKEIIKKVNSKIKNDNKKLVIACVAICAVIAILAFIFILPVKKIPQNSIRVSYEETPAVISPEYENIAPSLYNEPGWKDTTIFLYPAGKSIDECLFYHAKVISGYDFALASDYFENDSTPSVSVININSDYAIKSYREEYLNENGNLVFNLKNARTSLLGRQASNVESEIRLFTMDSIDNATVYGK